QTALVVPCDHFPGGHPGVVRHGPAVSDHFALQARLPHEGIRAVELLGIDQVIRVAVARNPPAVDQLLQERGRLLTAGIEPLTNQTLLPQTRRVHAAVDVDFGSILEAERVCVEYFDPAGNPQKFLAGKAPLTLDLFPNNLRPVSGVGRLYTSDRPSYRQ